MFTPPNHCCYAIPPSTTFADDFLEAAATDIGHYQPPFRVELR